MKYKNKIKINDKVYDVCELEDYLKNPKLYMPNYTAVIDGDYVYPILSTTQTGPGVRAGYVSFFEDPNDEQYNKKNMIDLNDVKYIADMIDKTEAVKKLESEVLTSVDNIFQPKIKPQDTPEMVALKTAVNKKHIDLDKYESRFNGNYANEKRLFNKSSISLGKIKRLGNALDMEITLSIKDAPGAPNPIGEEIKVNITGNNQIDEEEE